MMPYATIWRRPAIGQAHVTTQTHHRQPTTSRGPRGQQTANLHAERERQRPITPPRRSVACRNQRQQIEQDIRDQQNRLRANKENVANRLNELMILNGEIDAKQKDIEGFEMEIKNLDGNIGILKSQMTTLQGQLKDRQEKYIKSMRYMAKNRSIQDKLMFIFSAKSLTQAYRRMRFVQEYASYQRAQGEQIKAKQEEIRQKDQQLKKARSQKDQLLSKGKAAKAELQTKHNEQQQVVAQLQNEQKTIQVIIADQERKNAQINAEIDRLVAVEVEKARVRAEAEAKRKAEAAAAKKSAEEAAPQEAAAEAAKREEEKRHRRRQGRGGRAEGCCRGCRREAAEEAAEPLRRPAALLPPRPRRKPKREEAEAKAKRRLRPRPVPASRGGSCRRGGCPQEC